MLEDIVGIIVVIAFFAVPTVLVVRGEVKRMQAGEIRKQKREERRLIREHQKQERLVRKQVNEEASKAIEAQLEANLSPPSKQAELIAEWRGLLNRKDVLIVDTETTARDGLSPGETPEVMEVAAVDTTGELRFKSYAHTLMSSDDMSSQKAHLVRKGPYWKDVHNQLYDILNGASVVIAWNAGFDRSSLEKTSAKHGLSTPQLPWRDALADYRKLRPDGEHSLVRALDREGVRNNVDGPLHWARYDCLAILEVMRAVTRDRDDKVIYIRKLPGSSRSSTPVVIHVSAMCIRNAENWQAVRGIEHVKREFPNRRIKRCTRPWCFGSRGPMPKSPLGFG